LDYKKILETKWFSLNTVHYQSSDEEPYYYLSIPDSVEILAFTENNEIILVRQYRPAIGISMLELPAGYINPDEKPDDAVKRELTEETGYICDKIDYLGSFKNFPSRANNTLHLFFGSNSLLSLDDFDNDHEVVLLTQNKFISLIEKGDFFSVSGIATYYLTKTKGFL
jgi:8-oxo-dGTP pyrophosphatase MutT (NUDIX family)|tara:strand:- start:2188 stop:2691 length:504 start_codon:yes stop_codon:yes gene_type:complete